MRTPSRIRETGLVTCGFSSSSESPQRVRGKDAHWFDQARESRITPAHAGKSTAEQGGRPANRDHPRACGEKPSCVGVISTCTGSPPHMRGKAMINTDELDKERITPAHAGKSCPMQSRCRSGWDHPRACGEKPPGRVVQGFPPGSPPRMRRKAEDSIANITRQGITPAHAGKSTSSLLGMEISGDHPRTCGEKLGQRSNAKIHTGSPPHMRGKVYDLIASYTLDGITPAHAGKSPASG